MPHLNLPMPTPSTKLMRLRIAIVLVILSTVACSFLPSGTNDAARVVSVATSTPRPTFTPTTRVKRPEPIPKNNSTPLPAPVPRVESAEMIAATPTAALLASPDSNLTATTMAPPALDQPTATATIPATPTDTAIPTDTPTPAPTDTPAPTVVPTSDKWAITSLKEFAESDDSFIINGEFVNNSGATQRLTLITGDFFDETGEKIAGEEDTSDYWATDIVPPNGRLPFELTVYGINQAADSALYAQVEPSSENLMTDFQATNLDIYQEPESYCIDGDVNFGDRLQKTLTILITGYNTENEVIGFGDDYFLIPGDAAEVASFSICINDTDPSSISQHSIQIWGK